MDYEYDGVDDYGGRVLWGRVAFFAVALLLMFFLGRCTKSEGVPQSQVDELEATIEAQASQIAQLEATIAGGGPPTEAIGDPSNPGATETPSPGPTGGVGGQGQTYVVQQGDTLVGLAEQFYGDPQKYGLIVEANGIDEDNPLRVGQELTIPPDPDA